MHKRNKNTWHQQIILQWKIATYETEPILPSDEKNPNEFGETRPQIVTSNSNENSTPNNKRNEETTKKLGRQKTWTAVPSW